MKGKLLSSVLCGLFGHDYVDNRSERRNVPIATSTGIVYITEWFDIKKCTRCGDEVAERAKVTGGLGRDYVPA